ncbi:MAG TPA: hypothetical protein GXX36_02525 [Clostridiaceae bacterium]|nr:hypothetical protein [Clostridiaceae bacterium]
MQKNKRLLSLILIVVIAVTQLPVWAVQLHASASQLPAPALASGTGYSTGNAPGFSSTLSGFSSRDDLMEVADEVYETSQSMALASTGESEDPGLQYSLSLKIELNELRRSMSVQADINSLGLDAAGGELIVTLYDNKDRIPKLIDFFTAEVQSGVMEDTPDTPEAIGVLSFDGADPENLMVSGVICRSLDEPLPLSAAVSYDEDGFSIVPVSFCTLAATDVTKTSAVLHGQVVVEDGTELNAADFGFIVFDSLQTDAEEMDEDGNPVGVILPDVLPAASITSDGRFSLPLTNLESGREYQYMAVGIVNKTYGEPMSFTTKSDLPAVQTNASAEINSEINVVTLRGTITDTKGFEIKESGVMFGTDPDSDLTQKSPNQSGLSGAITCYIGQLDPGKTYYYRVYAKSSAGIGYGKTYSFTMPAVLPEIRRRPSVTFDPVTWKATFSAEILSNGGAEITDFGFRLKNMNEWKYFPAQIDPDTKIFTLELEGQEQIPIGYIQVEAYVTNTVGMATMAATDGILTPSRAQVNAGLDNTLITVSSAVLKGDITIVPGSECQQRGFEYKAVSDNLWIEAGMETGTFGSGEYTFTLEGLRPYTEYVFRAKAQTLAGWSYSPEIGFTTIFSDNGKETAYQMKMDGKTGKEILEILKNNLHQDISEACVSLKFAGFDASSIAAALKPAPYNAKYDGVAKGLLTAGFDASTAAKALMSEYSDVFEYIGGDAAGIITETLDEQGFPKDDIIKALREVFNIKIDYIGLYLDVTNDTVYDSLIRTYGAYAFSADFWREHDTEQYTDGYIRQLTTILKNCTTFSAGDIAAVLKEVYPQITAAQFVANCRNLYPAVSDMGDALIQAFKVDPSMAAKEMYTYSDIYTIEKIKDWLINKRGLSASQTVKVLLGLPNTEPMNTVPVLMKNNLGITTAIDAAKAMHAAGWGEEKGYGYWRPLKLLIDHYDCKPSDLIEIMKELGFSSLVVAQQMEALKNNNYITSWRTEYRALGYTASDLAGWCKTNSYYNEAVQAVIIMGEAGYSLDEITAALKQVYELDANGALTILQYDTFTDNEPYKWWTVAQAIASVDLAYNTSTLDTVIAQMKENGATAEHIANTLKEAFAVKEPGNVAKYLKGLGYGKDVVLHALAKSFRTLKNPELIQMLAQVLGDNFSEDPINNMELILSIYESVKGKLNHAVNGVILLHDSGFGLMDITRVLKNDIDALNNVAAPLTAFEAGQLLLGMKAYGLSYDKLDIFAAIQEVYGVNFMLETVVDYKNHKKYSAKTAITKLSEDFGIDTPSAAAMCLKEAGYTMAEVLEGFIDGYSSEKSIYKIDLLRQVLVDVYPEEQAPLKAIMEAMGITDPGHASEAFYRAGFSMKEIIMILQNEYGLSSGEVTECLYERNFENIVVNVEEVYGGNGYLDFILYRKKQGDDISQLFDWLYKKFRVADISQIVNTLKLAGFSSEDVITLLYEKRKVSDDETILQVQDVFGENSIQSYINHRKDKGDNITQVFNWLQKFGVKDVQSIISYLTQAGYSSSELIEFLFSGYNQVDNAIIDVENTFGKNSIVDVLKQKKTQGWNIGILYSYLVDTLKITNLTQIANYLKTVGYTGYEIMNLLYQKITDTSRYGEIIAAVQAANADKGTDAILEFLRAKKEAGEALSQLYNWLKDKFNITDMTQTVTYLKAVGYTSSDIMDFLYQVITEPSRYGEIAAAVQAADAANGTDAILEFLCAKKEAGQSLTQMHYWLKDKFNITDMTQTATYLKAVGYTSSEIMDFLYQVITEPGRYGEIAAAVQAANAANGTDVILEFLRAKKEAGEGLSQLHDWLKDKFNITDMTQTVAYLKAAGYTSSEIIDFWCARYSGEPDEYEEVIEAIQAASNTDVTLDFLREKKTQGEGLIQLYGWMEDKFGISDINKVSSYFLALGYNSSEIIEFLYQKINDTSRYEEIVAAVQAASASTGSDTILEFLKYRKGKGEGLTQFYSWLKDNFGISDINRIAPYFMALGYNNSEIIEFLYQMINDTSRYEEIVAAVQAASASTGSDTILEFLKYRKGKGEGLTQFYGWLKDKFGIGDLNKVSSYFLALGYSSSEIIDFLYQQINDQDRYEEIVTAVQAASASTGSDTILEFLKYRKGKGEGLTPLYGWLKDKFGINDLNKVSSYFLALEYNSSEIIEFLVQQISDPSRYEEIDAAVQAAIASTGSDAILEFLKYRKSKGEGLILLYGWLKDKLGITDISKILRYLKETGYSSSEIIEFAYSGQTNLNELLIASMQNNYSEDSVIELLVFRKSRGGGLTELYDLLAQLNITEARQVAVYLQVAGFSGAEVAAFFKQKGINNNNQIITLIQSVYGENAIADFLIGLKNNGYTAGACRIWLIDKLGIDDIAKITRYLKDAGFNDGEIIYAFDSTGDAKGFAVLKALYPAETPVQILARLMAIPSGPVYSTHKLICGLKQEFPALKYSEIILIIRDAGEDLNNIVDWLQMVNYEGAYYLGLPKDDLDDLASILGSRNENDLKLGTRKTSYILSGFGYSLEEVVYWAKYAKFSSYEVFKILLDYWVGMVGSDKIIEQLQAMESNGYTLTELAEALIAYYREGKLPPGSGNSYLVENPYGTASNTMKTLAGLGKRMPDVVTAMIHAGLAPRYLINALHGYWYDRYYWKDPMPNHYPHTSDEFALLNIVTWVYNAVESLPEEKLADIDIVEETAAGLYTIRDTVGAENSKIFEAMMYITGKMTVNWSEKIPQTDIYAIDDLLNTVNSFVSAIGKKVNNILERVLVVNAMRTAGYNNDEATDLLKSVVGTSYLMNFAMQVMGGYNIIDSWNAVMRVDAYRVQVLVDVCWTIACNAYRLDKAYTVLKDIKKVYDKLKKICMFLIDKGVLQAAPGDMTMAAFAGFAETMSSGMATAAGISDITFSAGENSTVTVRGTVSSGAGTELLLLVKKPDANGNSQKDVLLNSLTDQELKGIIDYFGYVCSTEPAESDGASYNFELRYRSGGAPGKYTVLIGTADIVEAHTAEPVLFTRTLAGKVSITGIAKVGETLTADISELINAAGTLTYQWYRAEQPITGANSSTYTLVTEDIGKTITVGVTADGIYAEGSVISDATGEVIRTYAVNIGSLTGGTITASSATAAAGETISLTIIPDTGMRLKAGSLEYNDGTGDHKIDGTSFTMPAADITVTAEFEAITYTVSIRTLFYGSITATPTTAAAGETVNLTITPDEGRRLKAGSLKYNDGTGDHEINGTSFTMPAADVEIMAEFERVYTVNIGELYGGSITATPAVAAAGETVSLTITPEAGLRLRDGSLRYYDGTGFYAINGTSFTMPYADVTVTAQFEMIPPTYYTVNIGPLYGGSISAIPTTAAAGETITLNISPDTGKRLKAGSLKYNDGTGDYVISGISFTMPAANVTVTAEFEEVPPAVYTISIDSTITGGTIMASPTTAIAGETITLTITPDAGKRLKAGSLKYNDGMTDHEISGTSFTMPAANVAVTAEFEEIPPAVYTVSIDDMIIGGTIIASPNIAAAGETITLTIIPDAGKQLKAGSLKYSDGELDYSINGTSFIMPEVNVTVTAEFEDIKYTVSVDSTITGGTIMASPTKAIAGETITLTITPDEGKRLKERSLKYNDGTGDYVISGTSFTMPAANVTVTAEFEEVPPAVYTISIDSTITGGTIMASPKTAIAGETITLSIIPEAGKRLKAGSLKYNDGTGDYVISGYSFTMPTANVTVTAEFEGIPPTVYTVSVDDMIIGGTIIASLNTAAAGETITLTIIPDAGKQLKAGSLKYNDGVVDHEISGTSFTMPAANVTVTAEFEEILPAVYTVSIDSTVTGGAIVASPISSVAGGIINLTITPDVGKRLKEGSLKYNDGVEDYIISGTSFTMPAANVTVTAEFEEIPLTDYDKVMADIAALSIGYAPGDNAAAVTQNVSLATTGAIYGSVITWTSSNTAVISNSGVVTRPGFADGDVTVTLTATVYNNGASSTKDFELVVLKLPQITYTVTFDKNGGDTEASPAKIEVISGGTVGTLPTAPTRSGYTFKGWNTQANGNGTVFTAATVVTGAITVYAQWSINNSGGGGGIPVGIIGINTPIETPKTEINVEGNTVTASTTVTATEDSSGNAAAIVSQAQLSDAIDKAMEEAEKQGDSMVARVEIKVEASADATGSETIIPEEAVSQALKAGIEALTISTHVASITFDANTLSSLSEEATGDLKITVSRVEASSLSSEAQRLVGDRPVFDFNVTSGGKVITQFGGDVTVSVPYTPKEGEDTNAIVIYYINASGKLEVVSNCIYDPATGMVHFSTRHFSRYAVGYNKISFMDVPENTWYSKAVSFIAARGITTGTGGGNFSPEARLTRGQFIVLLMRAYGIAPDTEVEDNFADAGDTYYTGYLAAAKRLGISRGVGNNMFAPDKEITRQEMFTLLYNALKIIGRLPEGTAGKPLSAFADAESIAPWAKEAMTLLVETGTIGGNGGKLSPTGTTTRAEMAQVIYNLLSRYKLSFDK